MPTVSGETLALPESNSSQALACTAGNTAFCAASPEDGRKQRAARCRVFLHRFAVGDGVLPDFLDRGDHVIRHALGNEDAEIIGRRGEARKRLRQRRNGAVALEVERLVADGGERAEPLAADHVGLFDRQLGRDLGFAGNGGDHRRVAAVIGDVAIFDVGDLGDQFHRVVAGRCDTGGRNRNLAGLRLHGVEQFLGVLIGRLRIDADHLHVGDAEKQVPVLDRGIERAQRLVGAEILRGAGGPGVTVLGRFQRAARADRARCAGLVDDHDGLAERLLHLAGDQPRDLVGRAARGPGHDQIDRPHRLPVRGLCRQGQKAGADG